MVQGGWCIFSGFLPGQLLVRECLRGVTSVLSSDVSIRQSIVLRYVSVSEFLTIRAAECYLCESSTASQVVATYHVVRSLAAWVGVAG